MEKTVLIAKIIGVIYLSFGVGLLFHKKYYANVIKALLESTTFYVVGGFLAIIFGLLIIEYHNIWVKNWTVLITIIGWMALLKGILLLAFPKSLNIFKPMFESEILYKFLAPFIIIFGIIFVYLGFFS